MEKSGGFDMSKLSMASKILLGGGVLLLIDSFLSWQQVCIDTGVIGNICAKANAWSGNGSFAGVLMGLLLIALIVFEIVQIAGALGSATLPVAASKISAYIGFGAAAFGILKFILAVTNHGAIFAWIGLVLALAVAYGAWMRFQEPETAMPPPAAGTGDSGGFTA